MDKRGIRMIYITGDTHGDFARLGKRYLPYIGAGDYLIICGDFGGIWNNSPEENFWLKWLSQKAYIVLFVDGNHENYDMLATFPMEEWNGGKVQKIRENVIHLMRGQIYEIDGVRFFTMGGASSHDINAGILEPDDPDFTEKRKRLDREMALYRVNHQSWWAEELPSEEEMAEGLKNLDRCGNKVDVILTHCAPSSVQDIFSNGLYAHDRLTDYLDSVKDRCAFRHWFFGHYHDNHEVGQRFTMLYKEVVSLDDWLVKIR